MATEEAERTGVLVIAVSTYGDEARNRPAVEDAGREFLELFSSREHIELHPALVGAPSSEEISEAVASWGQQPSTKTGLLLWTGHCELSVNTQLPFLVTGKDGKRVGAGELGEQLAEFRFDRWLIVIDACYAFRVGAKLAEHLNRVVGHVTDSRFAILSSVDDLDKTEAGLFTSALAAVLREGPRRRWWANRQRFINFDTVLEKLGAYLAEHSPTVGAPLQNTGGRRVGECFPNPTYTPTSIAEALDEAHFLPKARGIEAGETGWFFTGREEPLARIVSWMRAERRGLFVITGSAGTGKSAVIGRIITLSIGSYRRIAEEAGVIRGAPSATVPDEGAVQLAFHAKDRRVDELLQFLSVNLETPAARDVSDFFEAVAGAASGSQGFTLVVDALDEAAAGHSRRMLDEILAPLATQAKVLVGTRPGVADWPERGLDPSHLVDLDRAPHTRRDIEDYANRRLVELPDSPYRTNTELAAKVAAAVAEASVTDTAVGGTPIGSFLVARVITKTLAASPPVDASRAGWERDLPRGLERAFEEDLAAYGRRHGRPTERLLRDLLEALAWDEGAGIPRRLIPYFAKAVTGRSYDDDDVTTLLILAGGHITEAEVDGWAVYRLYHERFREHLRGRTLGRLGVA